ncbi:MAG: hypothetical protein R3300_04330 [Candidatus Promineifilaceae bacterium]|nr:hypothetical protein [Candidatus Promineifilaceae bacterium]
MRPFAWQLAVVLMLLVASGCNDEPDAPEIGSVNPTGAATGAPAFSDSFALTDFDSNLAGLERHRTVLTADFQARDGGADWQLVSRQTMFPGAKQLEVEARGTLLQDAIGSFTATTIGQQAYLEAPVVGCIASSDDEVLAALQGPLDPDFFLAGLNGAQLSEENVLINGAVTRRYHFGEDALPEWNAPSVAVNGDLFVEEASGLVRRASLTMAGLADFLDRGVSQDGTLAVTIDVLDVDPDVVISAPASCLNDGGYPRVEDAFDVTVIDDLLTYRTNLTIAEVIDFYEAEMPALGWQADVEERVIVDGTALLTFRREQEQVVVTIAREQATNRVNVVVGP